MRGGEFTRIQNWRFRYGIHVSLHTILLSMIQQTMQELWHYSLAMNVTFNVTHRRSLWVPWRKVPAGPPTPRSLPAVLQSVPRPERQPRLELPPESPPEQPATWPLSMTTQASYDDSPTTASRVSPVTLGVSDIVVRVEVQKKTP